MPKLTGSQITNLKDVPPELADKPLWCGYQEISNPKKPQSKPRKRPHLTWAKSKGGPKAWKTLSDALASWAYNSAGVQRFIDKADGLVYIDLDHARNKDTGAVEPWAQKIIEIKYFESCLASSLEIIRAIDGIELHVRHPRPPRHHHMR